MLKMFLILRGSVELLRIIPRVNLKLQNLGFAAPNALHLRV